MRTNAPRLGASCPRFSYVGLVIWGDDMAGKFELYLDAAKKYRWRLKAGNGEIIAVGEAYESKAGAQNGIDSVKRNAPEARVEDDT